MESGHNKHITTAVFYYIIRTWKYFQSWSLCQFFDVGCGNVASRRSWRMLCCFWNSIIKPSSVCSAWPQRCKILFINVLLKDKATNNGSCHTVTRTSRPAVLMFTPQISKFPQQKTPTYLCAERKTDVSKLRTPTLELGGTWGLMGLIWSLQQECSAKSVSRGPGAVKRSDKQL